MRRDPRLSIAGFDAAPIGGLVLVLVLVLAAIYQLGAWLHILDPLLARLPR